MKSRLTSTFTFDVKQAAMAEATDANGSFGYFEGYASIFNNIDSADDIIEPGAFSDTLRSGRKLKLHLQHNMMKVLGSILEAYEDTKGLFVKGRINLGTSIGKDAYMLLKAGDIDSMSIGYTCRKWEWDGDIRRLQRVELYEVSLVSSPANAKALVTDVKSDEMLESAESTRDIERILRREGGFTKEQAKTLIRKIKSTSSREDEMADDRREDAKLAEWKQVYDSICSLTKQI